MRVLYVLPCVDTLVASCQTPAMGRTKEQFIEATGGFDITNPPTLSPEHGETIRRLEERLVSGKLSPEGVERTLIQIRNLKGLPPDEWDYENNNG